MTPTPPPQHPAGHGRPDEQGIPPRQFPYMPGPAARTWMRTNDENVFMFVLDSGNNRSVTFWEREAVVKWRDAMTELLEGKKPSGITVADIDDIRQLHDAGPFTEGQGR